VSIDVAITAGIFLLS